MPNHFFFSLFSLSFFPPSTRPRAAGRRFARATGRPPRRVRRVARRAAARATRPVAPPTSPAAYPPRPVSTAHHGRRPPPPAGRPPRPPAILGHDRRRTALAREKTRSSGSATDARRGGGAHGGLHGGSSCNLVKIQRTTGLRGCGWHAAYSRIRLLASHTHLGGGLSLSSPHSHFARSSSPPCMAPKREFEPSADDHEAGSSRPGFAAADPGDGRARLAEIQRRRAQLPADLLEDPAYSNKSPYVVWRRTCFTSAMATVAHAGKECRPPPRWPLHRQGRGYSAAGRASAPPQAQPEEDDDPELQAALAASREPESPAPSDVSSRNTASPPRGVVLIDGDNEEYYWE
ncbi:hypothetical protein QYE76_049289 [Lolium multiflorum]|uniref:Uncharacterized protein n=1 Tax=Lolium multiflorum TaxID=4521 RepID=A0AAD8SNM9_LOLMU|nr:hypothetical protein QYE76_049289 [Lolium multiflorum]